jgi:hypothetical protein
MSKKIDEFLKLERLINDSPELPVYCLVDNRDATEQLCRWDGNIRKSEVAVCAFYNGEVYFDRDEFKEGYYDSKTLSLDAMFGYVWWIDERYEDDGYSKEEIEANKVAKKKLDEYLDGIADEYFKKGIIVHIDLLMES